MRRNAVRSVAALIVGAFLLVVPGLAAAAPAAAYPAGVCASLSVSATVVRVGESIAVTGSNFVPRAKVGLALKPAAGNTTAKGQRYNLKTVTANGSGAFSTSIVMPDATTNQGNFILFATSGAPNDSQCPADPAVVLTLGVADQNDSNNPSNNGNPGTTAFTGFNILWFSLLAAALVAGGVYLNRRGSKTLAGSSRR